MLKLVKRLLNSRSFVTSMLIILQALIYVMILSYFAEYYRIIQIISYAISIIFAVSIFITNTSTIDVKLPWVILILIFPVFGVFFYLLFERQKVRRKIRKNIENQSYSLKKIRYNLDDIYEEIKSQDLTTYSESKYIYNATNMPIYKNSTSNYLKDGETYFVALVNELQKAKSYIFMEYYILKPGIMWDKVLNILKEKAQNGVEVRLLYDDIGCISTLPTSYKKQLESFNIKCQVFNPATPAVTLAHNNRDHRKIAVIDGKVAFTGGINLSDEYINEWKRFGHWKDTGIVIKGEAVKSFVLMFLENWHIYRDKNEEISKYIKVEKILHPKYKIIEYLQPYMSTPMDREEIIARSVYVNILNGATKYVYITTPYLILDSILQNAIINAAKRSVDVRIITPHIPDKKIVFACTRSYYYDLLKNGVKIFEYIPGFIHAKNVICDDKIATIGTINFDNRSFYHNYECGIFVYNSKTVIDMKEDFKDIQALSQKIYLNYQEKLPLKNKIKIKLFRLLSPLL